MKGFRQSHAVVIGIDGYGQGIPSLRTAVNDARRIARVLEKDYGYSVRALTENASLVRLRAIFDETLPKEIEADDRLLVYFAGHGIALDGDDGPAGYLVPQDAGSQDKNSFLAMTDLNGWLNKLPCRHLLLILDCCFAGAYRWSSTRDLGAGPKLIHRERFDRYIKDPAWQMIASAAYDQKALDVVAGEILGSRGADDDNDAHSPFALALLRALENGEADLIPRVGPNRRGGDGVITATELYLYLRECVELGAEAGGHLQTPGLWPLKKHDKGEYIHLVPGHPLNLPPAPEIDEANNPWRGLQSYDEEHAHVFFGRSRVVSTLANRVRAHPLTVVVGASGTGKSSVVKAGLLAELRRTEPDAWQILRPIRPGKSPLASLAGLSFPGEMAEDLNAHLAEFRINPDALAIRMSAWTERESSSLLLLVIDQFEELSTLCWDVAECHAFLQLLQRAITAHPARLRVVLTLRSDFEPQFAHTSFQDDWINSRVVVPALTLDEYRETIEGPASIKVLYYKGNSTSEEFINRLIGDVANTPGALPLLSFTLSELYRRYLQRRGNDRALCEEDYEALGGVGGSLRTRAEEVYTGLTDDATRATMQRVMLRMISLEAGEVARRHVPDMELVYTEPAENTRVAEVLRRLTEARLVVEGKETDDEPYVEPAHDEFVRGWSRLLVWIRDDAEDLQLRRRLSPAASAWGHGHGGLWLIEPRIGMLHKILDSPKNWLNAAETRFVRRSWFWRRAGQSAVAIVFLALCVITWSARHQQLRAVKGEADAIRKEKTGASRRLAALSEVARTQKLDLSLVLAAEGLRIDNTLEARESLYHALEERPGITSFLQSGQDFITSLVYSPDGQTLAAGFSARGNHGGVVLWKLNTPGRPSRLLLEVDRGFTRSVAFSPDGQTIAAGLGVMSHDMSGRARDSGGVALWDLATLKPRTAAPIPINDGIVMSVTFSRDSKTVAAGLRGGVKRRTAASKGLLNLKSSPDASEHGNGGVVLLDADTGKSRLEDPLPVDRGEVLSVVYSPDGKTIAAGFGDPDSFLIGRPGGVVLWDADTPHERRPYKLDVKEGQVVNVDYSNDGKTIATAYHVRQPLGGLEGRGGVVLWDAVSGQRKMSPLLVPEGDVTDAAFSSDGESLVVGYSVVDLLHPNNPIGGVVLWDVRTGHRRENTPLHVNEGRVSCLAIRPHENTIAVGYRGSVLLYDPEKTQRLTDVLLTLKDGYVGSVAYNPERKTIAAAYGNVDKLGRPGDQGGVELWEQGPSNRLHQRTLDKDADSFVDLVFRPDGQILAAGYVKGPESGVVLWDLLTGQRRKKNPLRVPEGHVGSVAYSLDGNTIAAGFVIFDFLTGRGGVVLYDGNTLEPSLQKPLLVPEGPVSSLAFRPDGETLVVGFTGTGGSNAAVGSGGVLLLNARTGKRRSEVLVPEGHVVSVAYSSDGNTIAAGYRVRGGGGVVLINADTGQRRLSDPLRVTDGDLKNVAFSSDGQTIAASFGVFAGVDRPSAGGVLIWNASTGEPLVENPLPVKEGSVNCVVWADPGFSGHSSHPTIAAGYRVNTDGGLVLRDMSLDSWLLRASQIANRNFSWNEWSHYHPGEPYHRTFDELPDGEGVAESKGRHDLPTTTPIP
jgi:WD40 repeat protein